MTTILQLDSAQRFSARQRANDSRSNRRELKARLRVLGRTQGAVKLAEIMVDPPVWLGSVLVFQVVQYVPRVGESAAIKMLKEAKVDSWTRVRLLNVDQRVMLVGMLRAYAAGRPLVRRSRPNSSGAPSRPKGARCLECGEHLRSTSLGRVCGFCKDVAA